MSTNENKPNGLELENDEPRLEAGEINPDNETIEDKYSQGDKCIDFSVRVVEALSFKKDEHNKLAEKQVNLSQLKKVYCRGAGDCSHNLEGKTCGQIAMARVNMFLRMRLGGICSVESKGNASISNLIDISENWFPSEEDFIKADEDIKNYNLDYDFGNINELYLEEYDKLDWEWM
tara:strand:+ start:1922 stop:2449 length:528 start_codon:yes stop_codon:yes gene_type:complete